MMVLDKNGYELLEAKVTDLGNLATLGMQQDSSMQGSTLREIRSGLFSLLSTMKETISIEPDPAPPPGLRLTEQRRKGG